MSEFREIVQEKIRRDLAELKEALRQRLGKKKSEFASRNVLHSSMHVQAIVSECSSAYKEAVPIVCKELEWWLKQCLYVTERKSKEIADFGVKQMADCLYVELNFYVEGARKYVSNGGMLEPIVAPYHGHRVDAESEIKLFVRQWRAEHQRNFLRSLGPMIRKLVGLG